MNIVTKKIEEDDSLEFICADCGERICSSISEEVRREPHSFCVQTHQESCAKARKD